LRDRRQAPELLKVKVKGLTLELERQERLLSLPP
jgi:hypothetical protein